MADDGTIVALNGGSFVRLRGDGAVIGMPMRAVGGEWIVARGPFDARVSPDGARIAYWFTGRRRFCLPIDPRCSVQDSDVTAYAYADRVTDPLELGAVRDYREPSWLGSGRAVLFRHATGTGETVAVNRVGGGEAEREGWFSYDDGTQLGQGQASRGGDKFAALAGTGAIHLFGLAVAAAGPAGAALHRARRALHFARRGRPTAACSRGPSSAGIHVAGPVPDLRAPVPDCGVIRERRLAAGSDPFRVLPTCPALRRWARAPRPASGGRRPGARLPRAAGRAPPARPGGAAAPADRARAGTGRRPPDPRPEAGRAHGRAPRSQGRLRMRGAAEPPRPHRARAPGAASCASRGV